MNKKRIIIISIVALVLLLIPVSNYTSSLSTKFDNSKVNYWSDLDTNTKADVSEKILFNILSPNIKEAIKEYYKGDARQYVEHSIVSAKKNDSGYIVTVRVLTYIGAYKPPLGVETLEFDLSENRVDLLSFNHVDEQSRYIN